MSPDRALAKRHRLVTHGLVAFAAMAAAYFYLFYGSAYLYPHSLPATPDCAPRTVTLLVAREDGERVMMAQTKCGRGDMHIGLYLQDSDDKPSRPFLILEAARPVIHAVWVSRDVLSFDIQGDDIDVAYALDRVRGIGMKYTMTSPP